MHHHNPQKLAAERVEKAAELRRHQSILASAEQRYMRTRSAGDGASWTDAKNEVHRLEIAIRGIDQDLARLSRPQPVQLHTTDAAELHRQRALLMQQRDYAERQRKAQEDTIRAVHRGASEAHLKIYVSNSMSSSARAYAKAQGELTARIENLTGQLAELERRRQVEQGPTSPEAA